MFIHRDPKVSSLARIDVLAGLSRRDLQAICSITTDVLIREGRLLCRQGAVSAEVFLILDGLVEVDRDGELLATVGAGGTIGEMGLVEAGPRNATATAVTDVRALVLGVGEFRQLLEQFPAVATNVRALTAQRHRAVAA